MNRFLRKLRGTVGVGLTWGVVFAAITYITGTTFGVFDPDSIDPGEEPRMIALFGGLFGFISGVVFATLMTLSEGRKTLRDLSIWRSALWGFLGASALPLLTTANDSMALILGPLGASLAAGSVAIARRAELQAAKEPPPLRS